MVISTHAHTAAPKCFAICHNNVFFSSSKQTEKKTAKMATRAEKGNLNTHSVMIAAA